MDKKVWFTKGYKYLTSRELLYKLNFGPDEDIVTDFCIFTTDGYLFIKKWYPWDGASGPTLDTDSTFRGSLVHDLLYHLMRLGLLPEGFKIPSDKELYIITVEDGMWRFRARAWRFGLKNFATGYKPKHKKKEYCNP